MLKCLTDNEQMLKKLTFFLGGLPRPIKTIIQIASILLCGPRNVIRHVRTNRQQCRLREREKPHLGPLRKQINRE